MVDMVIVIKDEGKVNVTINSVHQKESFHSQE